MVSPAWAAQTTDKVVFGNARFTVINPECIRLEYASFGKFVDAPSMFAVNRNTQFLDFKSAIEGKTLTIDTGRIRLTYSPNGQNFSPTNLSATIYEDGKEFAQWAPGQKNRANLGGTRQNLDQVKGPVEVGDGLLARDGWYLLDDSNRFLLVGEWVAQRPENSGTDWYLFGYGTDFKSALKTLTSIGGKIPLPRKYVLGSWYSRWWKYTSQDYRDIVKEYHDHYFPLDMVVMDMDWHKTDSWTGYTWNRALFPDAENYLRWLHDEGLHVTLNDHPQGGVGTYEDHYTQFMNDLGPGYKMGDTIAYNVGNKHYIDTLFKDMHEPLEKMGVDFWWLDWMGDKNFLFNNLSWVNEYYFRHSEKTAPNIRGLQFSRWADWGDHRHPIHFSGDTHIGWETLQFEVPFTANSGNVGAFFWSHDIGGFEGLLPNGELLARWAQFGAFTANLRLHSTNHFNLDKRPWKYSQEVFDSMRIAFHLRRALFPYTYSTVWQSHHDSLPLTRPLYLEYPHEAEAYNNPQEYLYGDAFLVAPIVTAFPKVGKREASQKVWLPAGTWYDWFTGEKVLGPVQKTVARDLYSFPLFVKAGVPIPMMPYTERMTQEPLTNLIVRAYPGEEGATGSFELYEDDGISKDYLSGHYSTTVLSYVRRQNTVSIEIQPTFHKAFHGQLTRRSYTIELPITNPAKGVAINGVPTSNFSFDSKELVTKIVIQDQDASKPQSIQVTF